MDVLDNIRIRLQKIYGERSKEYKLLKNKKNVSLLRKYKNGHMVDVLDDILIVW